MGAQTFYQYQDGADVNKAFNEAVSQAQYDHGHRGYTGSLAEKGEFTIIQKEPLRYADAESLAYQLVEDGDPRVDDKWGPAGAIRVKGDTHQIFRGGPSDDPNTGYHDVEYDGWLFFGWASS